jgi:hypothetical protein
MNAVLLALTCCVSVCRQTSPSFHPLGIVVITLALVVDAAIVNMQVSRMITKLARSITY